MVDYVTWFDETDPRRSFLVLSPMCMSMAQNMGRIVLKQRSYAPWGKIHIVAACAGLSTSQIIKKIIEHALNRHI